MSAEGIKVIAALLASGDLSAMREVGDLGEIMSTAQSDKDMLSVVEEHLNSHGKLPSPQTFMEDYGETLPKVTEPLSYYAQKMRLIYVRKSVKTAMAEANAMLVDDPMAARDMLDTKINSIKVGGAVSVLDFRKSGAVLKAHMASKGGASNKYFQLGWAHLDDTSGGMGPGDLLSIAGRPGLGKTQCLLSRAMHVWHHYKIPTGFVTIEVSRDQLLERMAALHSKTPADYLKTGMFPNLKHDYKAALYAAMDSLENPDKYPAPFWIIDGNLTSKVQDVGRLARQLGLKSLWVDGAYMLQFPGARSKVERISGVVEYLKMDIAMGMGMPVAASWQFGRPPKDEKGAKKGQRRGTEDIAGSDAIPQYSTMVLGLEHPEDSPETIHQRVVDVVKGRNGETGQFLIHWDFKGMNFGSVEIDPEQEEEFD